MSNLNFNNPNEYYADAVVSITSQGKDIVVISDLHLSSGLQDNGNYDGTENFYADDSLARFLQYLTTKQTTAKTIFIINGDFIDFIRIRHFPTTGYEFEEWSSLLSSVGISKTSEELKNSISKKETDFGLKTDDYKSVWKLHKCMNGHKAVFQQLAVWLANGNQLLIVKGNHDLEWYWAAVRNYLRYALVDFAQQNQTISNIDINQNLIFIDDSLIIDGKIHIVHGHVFENMTEVKGAPVLNDGRELNLPFGSFFNRYLINRLELAYPFIDNIRPSQKILPLLIRERFPLAIKVLFHYIPFTILIIPKKMYRQVFKYLFDIFIIIILPVAITAYALYKNFHLPALKDTSLIGGQLIGLLKNLAPLFLSYIFGRLMAMARLSSPTTFFPFAQKIYNADANIQTVIFGHTHNPEIQREGDKYYFNTGTWMPVYDLSMADVRMDKTYTYLHIIPGQSKQVDSQLLLRWNDDAARPEPMVLRELK